MQLVILREQDSEWMAEMVAATEEGPLDCLVDPDGNPHVVRVSSDGRHTHNLAATSPQEG